MQCAHIEYNGLKDVLFELVSVPLQPEHGVVCVSVVSLQEGESLVADTLHLIQLLLTACVCGGRGAEGRGGGEGRGGEGEGRRGGRGEGRGGEGRGGEGGGEGGGGEREAGHEKERD